ISGNPSVSTFIDYFGNTVGSFMHPTPHIELIIDSQLEVKTIPRILPEDTMAQQDQWNILAQIKNQLDFIDFTRIEPVSIMPDIKELIKNKKPDNSTPLQVATAFCDYVYHNFKYQKGVTTVESTPE